MSNVNADPPDSGDPPGELNIVTNGVCTHCESDNAEEFVSCMFCNTIFHMNGCLNADLKNILPNTCAKHFHKAINKSGKFAHRPGNFRFICDPCITKFENSQTCTTNDNVQILDNRVTNLASDMKQVKDMLQKLTVRNDDVTVSTPSTSAGTTPQPIITNVWQDSDKIHEIKTLLVVNKDVILADKVIEDSVTASGIQVKGKYINKKGDTAFILPSQKAKEDFKSILQSSGVSSEKITEPKQRYPSIAVVGISNQFDRENKDSLVPSLLRQNPGIANIVNLEGSIFEILTIKPVKSNPNIKQAIIRVSDNIRYAIKSTGDRIFSGLSSCKVYDQLYIKRCNKCQDFGHYAKDCKGNVCCGLCSSGDHETKDCIHKDKPDLNNFMCCINCKKAGLTDLMHSHQANSTTCSSYVAKQEKLKSTTSYYINQKNLYG